MLTGKQKRQLRALGHSLKPVIQIGKKEIEETLIVETNAALDHHELIKVKLLESCLLNRQEAADILANSCSAEVAQVLGRTFLLYRAAKEPVISFSDNAKPTRKAAKPATSKPEQKVDPKRSLRSRGTARSPKKSEPTGERKR